MTRAGAGAGYWPVLDQSLAISMAYLLTWGGVCVVLLSQNSLLQQQARYRERARERRREMAKLDGMQASGGMHTQTPLSSARKPKLSSPSGLCGGSRGGGGGGCTRLVVVVMMIVDCNQPKAAAIKRLAGCGTGSPRSIGEL